MAFRFRRSMKLGKGLRLNVSKRGVGMSFGTRGLRKSIHSTGSRTNTIGIPGTGLSYVDRSYGKKAKTDGRRQADVQKKRENELAVENYNNYLHAITNMHQQAIDRIDWKVINNTPIPFSPGEMGPKEKEAANEYDRYTPSFLERLFKSLAAKKREQLTNNIEKAKRADAAKYENWKDITDLAAGVLAGEPEAYRQVIKNSQKFSEMRERSTLNVVSPHTLEMGVQVEPKDIVPKKKVQLTKTGKLSKRKMGKKRYYSIIKSFVCSHAIWAARSLFASLPVDTCVIHLTENTLNTSTGHYEKRVLLSVSIDRKTLEQLNLANIDPADSMDNFRHNIDFRITKGFRSVKRID